MDKNEPWYVILNMDSRYEICRRCPKSGLFKGTYEECEKWIEQKKNEEMVNDVKEKLKKVIKNELDNVQKKNEESLRRELTKIMNTHGIDTEYRTPDYILAEYLIDCLKSYKKLDDANRTWHGLSIEAEIKL